MSCSAPRIGIVVTDTYSPDDPDHDTPRLVAALRERGADARAVVWHSDQDDLAAFDLLAIRSPWDYPERVAEFQSFLDCADAATHVVNSVSTMRWNLDKEYLRDLERAGIRIVPTTFCRTAHEVRAAVAVLDRVVVKPTVSAGARDTGLFEATDAAATALGERIIAGGGIAMVQPEIAELTGGAEKALYLVDGRYTHAIAKGALLEIGGGLIGGVYIEHPEAVPATEAERQFAQGVLRAVAEITGNVPAYARVDVVDSAAYGIVLLEVELVEPALNLHIAPHVTAIVADSLLAAARERPVSDARGERRSRAGAPRRP